MIKLAESFNWDLVHPSVVKVSQELDQLLLQTLQTMRSRVE
nr:Spo0E family sporulation regulatory protein-aspartic acid phosphatase [Paenibacillus cellulosilyticus]